MKNFLGFAGLAVVAYYILPPDFFRALRAVAPMLFLTFLFLVFVWYGIVSLRLFFKI
jgi:TRAP-type C4-dicarboxylate transport system permease small subunit